MIEYAIWPKETGILDLPQGWNELAVPNIRSIESE
jgi:uncharacterized protein YbdZ (MbtH family)